MNEQPTGILPGEGQAQPGNPQPAGQPQVTPPQQPNSGEQPKQPDNPQFAELQQKLATLEAQAKKNEESARYYQSNFDRAQQQLRAMTGVQAPPQDPYADKVKTLVAQGYDEKDARVLVGLTRESVDPVMQQLQAAQQTIQATSVVGDVLQAAASDPKYAALFANPNVQRSVQQAVQQAALGGQRDLVNPQYAIECAKLAWADEYWANGGQAMQPQPPQPQPSFRPFMGPAGGFSPAQAATKQVNPAVAAYDQELKQHFNLNK